LTRGDGEVRLSAGQFSDRGVETADGTWGKSVSSTEERVRFSRLGLIYGAILLGMLSSSRFRADFWTALPIVRPFNELTGLPCPFCGGTRSLLLLAGGRLWASLRTNPLIPTLVAAVLGWSAVDILVPQRSERWLRRVSGSWLFRLLLASLLLANWLYLILTWR